MSTTASMTSADISVPTIANKYVPLFELGQGGMGNVVLAVVQGPGGFNKLQVVKYLRPELAENPEFLAMFLDEARLSARINHANVVQTNEVGFDGHNYFIAMEYLEGQSLEAFFTRAAKKGPLAPQVFVRVLIDACAGLHHAHELADFDGRQLNVVHRDVSPHNIFITYDGQTKVLDFGIAKAADSSSQTRTGIIKGKVAYMAPEQFKSGSVDRRADIFALGAILWRIIAGRRLWKNLTDVEVYQHLATSSIPSPLEMNPAGPKDLVDICMKALSPNVEQRYQTAAEMQVALEEFLDLYPEKASSRIIGKQVSELFADRRASVKSAIEARLASGLPSASAVAAAIPQLFSSSSRELEGMPELFSDRPPPVSHVSPTAASRGFQAMTVVSPPIFEEIRAAAPAPAPRSRAPLVIGAVVLALIAVGAAVFVSTRVGEKPADAATASSGASTAAAASEASATTITITTDPADATVKLDDAAIEHRTVRPRDGAMHKLTVEAEGYLTHERTIELTSASMDLSVALERVRTPATASAAPEPKQGGGPAIVPVRRPVNTQATRPTTSASVASATMPATTPNSPDKDPKEKSGNGLDMGDPWARSKK